AKRCAGHESCETLAQKEARGAQPSTSPRRRRRRRRAGATGKSEERWILPELPHVKGELTLLHHAPKAAAIGEGHFQQSPSLIADVDPDTSGNRFGNPARRGTSPARGERRTGAWRVRGRVLLDCSDQPLARSHSPRL